MILNKKWVPYVHQNIQYKALDRTVYCQVPFVFFTVVWCGVNKRVILHLVNVIDCMPSLLLHITQLTLEDTDGSSVSCVAEIVTPIYLDNYPRLSYFKLCLKFICERIASQHDFKISIAFKLPSPANHDQPIWEMFLDVL